MSIAYDLNNRWSSAGAGKIDVRLQSKSIGGAARYSPTKVIDEFSDYEAYDFAGWDGYLAVPIGAETLRAARRFKQLLPRRVPKPDIAPGADGTIGFEWRSGPPSRRTVTFIEIGPGDAVKALRVYPSAKSPATWPQRPVRVETLDFISLLFPPDEPY